MLMPRRISLLRLDLRDRGLQDEAVDEADEAQLLDRRNEGAGHDDAAILGDHAQQAFMIIDRARGARHHRLIGEGEAAFLERPLHAFAQRHADAMAAALLFRQAIGHEAVAAGALGFGERGFGARHDFVSGLGLLGKGDAADRDGGVDRTDRGVDRNPAHRGKDLFRRRGDMGFRAMRQDDAEAVAADAADHVACAQALIEPVPDLDQHLVGGLVTEGVIDGRELVDADREIGAGVAGAEARGEEMIEDLAQPLLVEVAGELVVIGAMLETLLLVLARGDEAQHAEQALRPADAVELRRAAIMQPGEVAILEANAVLAIEAVAARVMGVELLLAQQQIVGVDALGEDLATRDRRARGKAQILQRALPMHRIGVDIPGIGDVARRGQRLRQDRACLHALRALRRAGRKMRISWKFSHTAQASDIDGSRSSDGGGKGFKND